MQADIQEKKRAPFRRSALIAATIALVAAGSFVVAGAQESAGCETNVSPIKESNAFTPSEARLSHLPEFPVTTFGEAISSPDTRMDGLPLRWEAGDGNLSSYRYFLDRPIDGQLTVAEFRAAGGIQLDRDAAAEGDAYTADDVIAQVGDRAVKVQIGDYEGALVWADPESNGARPHHLYWSDGTSNYALIAVRSPERMVQLGRELVCGG